jgi:DNA-binding IclR family transcriptional regulator
MPVVRSAPGESVTSRALSLLDAFDETHQALTLSQIARRSGVPLATAQRRLVDLVDGRLLSRRRDGLYEIAARMWHLGQLSRLTSMRETALPYLQDLVASTGHTAHIAVLDGLGALVFDRISGSRSMPTRHSPGSRLPLYCTGVGKVLLAFAPPEIRDQALRAMVPQTGYTITDPKIMTQQLAEIRRSRISHSRQEHRPGVSSIAAPVFLSGSVVASVGLLAPLKMQLNGAAEALHTCAHEVGDRLEHVERLRID